MTGTGQRGQHTPSTVRVHVVARAKRPNRVADLIIEPNGTVGTKDHLVGVALNEEWHLRMIANWSLAVGVAMIACSVVLHILEMYGDGYRLKNSRKKKDPLGSELIAS